VLPTKNINLELNRPPFYRYRAPCTYKAHKLSDDKYYYFTIMVNCLHRQSP